MSSLIVNSSTYNFLGGYKMKVQKTLINNEEVTQIFLSEEEANSSEKEKVLNKLKEEKANIVLFTAGKNNIEKALKGMLQLISNKAVTS